MAEDRPDSEEGVKEWLARRLGENLPARPRPTRPRPAQRTPPPLTQPSRSTPPPPLRRSERRPIPSTLIPRGETPRPAPVSVGPPPKRVRVNEAGFVMPDAARPTEAEDTAELLLDDTNPSEEPRMDFRETLRVPQAGHFAEPSETGKSLPHLLPEAFRSPDAFTADERFGHAVPAEAPFGQTPPPPRVDPDSEGDGDPVTRRLPPSEEEEQRTGELDIHLIDISEASFRPTPTLEHDRVDLPEVSIDVELSETGPGELETAEVPALAAVYDVPTPPLTGFETPPPAEAYAAPVAMASEVPASFERPIPPDSFLFAQPEVDTVVLPEDERPSWSTTGMWIVAGAVMGVLGFGFAVSGLLLWLWLLGR